LVKYCQDNDIVIQAYSPLVRGTKSADPILAALAAKHGKSATQVLIRYSLQKGWVPLPKSRTEARIRENADVFNFTLDDDDLRTLDDLDQGKTGAQFPANAS
jgi:diketogulonate reductase-like aldo/keto reductase